MVDEPITFSETDLRVARLEGRFDVLQPQLTISDRQLLTRPFVFQGTDGVAVATTDGLLGFAAEFKFYANTGKSEAKVMMTICNDSKFEMTVKFDDTPVENGKIPAGVYKSFTFEIPAGKSVCADQKGRYRIDS